MATRKRSIPKKRRTFRRNKKSKKRGGSNKSSPANSTGSLLSIFDESASISPTLSIGSIISPSPKKRKLTDVEIDDASNFLQGNPQNLFTKTPLNKLAALAADAIPLPLSKTRKRKRKHKSLVISPPKITIYKSQKEQIITENNLDNKIKNKNGKYVPMKTLSRMKGFVEDFIEHNDVEKSQQFYDNWREKEATDRQINRYNQKGSIDISGKQP